MLSSPDPRLRDDIGFSALARWVTVTVPGLHSEAVTDRVVAVLRGPCPWLA